MCRMQKARYNEPVAHADISAVSAVQERKNVRNLYSVAKRYQATKPAWVTHMCGMLSVYIYVSTVIVYLIYSHMFSFFLKSVLSCVSVVLYFLFFAAFLGCYTFYMFHVYVVFIKTCSYLVGPLVFEPTPIRKLPRNCVTESEG